MEDVEWLRTYTPEKFERFCIEAEEERKEAEEKNDYFDTMFPRYTEWTKVKKEMKKIDEVRLWEIRERGLVGWAVLKDGEVLRLIQKIYEDKPVGRII